MHHHRGLLVLSFSLAFLLWITVRQSLERGEAFMGGSTIATRSIDGVRVRVLTEPGTPTAIELDPATVTIVVNGRPDIITRLVADDIEAYVHLISGNSLGRLHPVKVQVQGVQIVSVNPQEILIQSAVIPDASGQTID